ncbi:hypothetical protein L198_02399 [Cryptococcus wingfieldii CBS 7118]|uniref:Protein Mpv17 n=1 Tax=Cryptococcus wingfieldii CBS 7118 TaxID=1295528 RepID=A0A1E3JRP2_9TREE|nr:hypothetical protein L198_02399 [Cryptococcus wingfieldii CBS 7118]ODO03551.1 hypothetical protein L198_02399 [Cryptococcus wingfieldii CBS 7118]
MPKRLLNSAVRLYNNNFQRRPDTTLIVTNGALNGIADALAQASSILLHKPTPQSPLAPKYDYARTLRFTIFGMAMGPFVGRWMSFLETRIPMGNIVRSGRVVLPGRVVKQRGGDNAQLAKRVLADQVIMGPIDLCLFVGSMGIMEGLSQASIIEKFQDVLALIADWAYWPIAQTINFKYMPLQYRVPFQSTCGIAWTVYLSILNADENKNLKEQHHTPHV